eukprot:jgi/Botrbrau1/4816/Bobra.0325s0035.1
MADEAKPRLDMSLDEIIKLHKKDSGPKKGKFKEARGRGRGLGSGRGTARAQGIKVQNRDPKAARAQEAQSRSAADRQAKLAQKRGLPASQQKDLGLQKLGGRGGRRGAPLRPRGGFRGRGIRGRGNVKVSGGGREGGGRSGVPIADQDLSQIRITIDNPLYAQRIYQQQQVPGAQLISADAQASGAPVWGSALYTNSPAVPGTNRARPGQFSTSGYVPSHGGRGTGSRQFAEGSMGMGRGFGRGDHGSRRGGGGRSGSQVRF